jgi:hypothetical protein
MAKFLVWSPIPSSLPNEIVLNGIVQDGVINIGMKSSELDVMIVRSIESLKEEKIYSASAGMNVYLHVTWQKSLQKAGILCDKIFEFK